MREAIQEIKHQGCLIKIYQDEDFQESPEEWGQDSFLVHYHRDLEVKRDDIITKDEAGAIVTGNCDRFDDGSGYFKSNLKELGRKYYFFPVDAYIHSGIWLSLAGGFSGRLPQGHERFDVSSVGLVLVSKKDAKNEKKAKEVAEGILKIWNDLLSGNVYGFTIEDAETGEDVDGCWGFIGDIEESGIIEEAKSQAGYYSKNEKAKARKDYYQKKIETAEKDISEAKLKLRGF